ncbi:MAG: ABC transporter ATP-binding protein/permease [Erythrobacter sp.]|uniref:ABC transporter ATP-binding protein n=1 Tax=Erythrobacter sp. TaxID=1042 RepID=UPI0025E0015D|nr:ABC transporter ATP-binding protein [Erythrobacter sp.]MCL9999363.1 ABC transporter ATP-binding protein/permease [Erythrobacter sp.]
MNAPLPAPVAMRLPEDEAGSRSPLRGLLALLSPRERFNAAILFGMMLVGALLEIAGLAAVPAFVSAVVDREAMLRLPLIGPLLGPLTAGLDSSELVIWGAAALLGIFAVKNGFLAFNYWAQIRYVSNRRIAISGRLMRAYMAAPYHFFLARNRSELLRNVDQEVLTVCYSVISTILELCTRMVIVIAVLGFLLFVEPLITIAWILFLGLIGFAALRGVTGRLRRYGLVQQQGRKSFNQNLMQAFGGIKEIRTLGREDFFTGKVMDAVGQVTRAHGFKLLIMKIIPPASEMVAMTGLLALAVGLVLQGRTTESILVTLSLFVVGLVRLREASSAALNQFADLRYSLVAIDPIVRDLALLGDAPPRETAPSAARPHRAIALEGVWHRYEGAADHALKDIDITIPVGSAVGLVGTTGAGKSTVVDVLLGLVAPERGGLVVDGHRLGERELRAWRRQVGYVPQSIYLLDDTIRRNIALGIEDRAVDEEALAAAIRLAQLGPFIDRQPDGLDTLVGESGVRISGGERQRIGIARALYHDPSILILDEATSALDNTTERAVIEAVEGMKGTRTVVMIAHRLSTVRGCEVLYYLKDGRVEGSGDYESLQKSHSAFREMAA